MTVKYFILFIIGFASSSFAKAQHTKTDSTKAATTLKSLLSICKNVDFADPETTKSGMFYKAAPYIIYRGSDEKRAWKDFANYSIAEEKIGVDAVCTRINESVNRDSSYKIVKYITKKESEGRWHVLMISYIRNGTEKKAAFAFLKIGSRFALGDID
jgi:hypothetical protein